MNIKLKDCELRLSRRQGSGDYFAIVVVDPRSQMPIVEIYMQPDEMANFISTRGVICDVTVDTYAPGKTKERKEIWVKIVGTREETIERLRKEHEGWIVPSDPFNYHYSRRIDEETEYKIELWRLVCTNTEQ